MMVRNNERGEYTIGGAGGPANGDGHSARAAGQPMTPKPLAPGVSSATTPHSLHPASNGAGPIPGFHTKNATSKEAASYVGFANIPNQVFRRAIKRGFDFTLMVVGQSGLGKSTFVNTLFMTEVNEPLKENGYRPPSTLKIDVRTVRLVENGVNLNLTLVDTPGFGDFVDNSKCWEPIVDFIDRKYLDYFSEETKIERSERIPDHRVHLCLYFIAPTGHGLKQLDIEFMKRLHDRVNVIPVIAKADTLTKDELARFKKQIVADMKTNQIKEYNFPELDDVDERSVQQALRERVPFAVVGSNAMREEAGGRRTRYREYAWGTVEVENMAHNDFIALRDMIIGDPLTQLEQERLSKQRELKERTANMDAVAAREAKLNELQMKLENRERENHRAIEERRAHLETLQNEVRELRQRAGLSTCDSRTSVNSTDHSPPEKNKKKGAMSIFGRGKTDD